jgi:hypothetical protein
VTTNITKKKINGENSLRLGNDSLYIYKRHRHNYERGSP